MKAKISKKMLKAVVIAAVRGAVANIMADEHIPTVIEIERVAEAVANVFGYTVLVDLFTDGICEIDLTDRFGGSVRCDIRMSDISL